MKEILKTFLYSPYRFVRLGVVAVILSMFFGAEVFALSIFAAWLAFICLRLTLPRIRERLRIWGLPKVRVTVAGIRAVPSLEEVPDLVDYREYFPVYELETAPGIRQRFDGTRPLWHDPQGMLSPRQKKDLVYARTLGRTVTRRYDRLGNAVLEPTILSQEESAGFVCLVLVLPAVVLLIVLEALIGL